MKPYTHDQIELAKTVRCPKCNADPHEPCISRFLGSPKAMKSVHMERWGAVSAKKREGES